MPETHNFQENDKPSYFNRLMFEGELSALTQRDDFDPTNLSVVLQINGVEVRIADFNEVLKGWGERIEQQVKDDVRFQDFDAAVEKRARELIEKKLGNTLDILNEVENSLWKLDVPD